MFVVCVIHVKNWDEIAGTTVVTVVNTMMNASKRTWRKWRQSRPSLGPGLKTAVSLMDMWTSENVEERMGRYFNHDDQIRFKKNISIQGNDVKLINLKVCHDHKSNEKIHHPANKILEVLILSVMLLNY